MWLKFFSIVKPSALLYATILYAILKVQNHPIINNIGRSELDLTSLINDLKVSDQTLNFLSRGDDLWEAVVAKIKKNQPSLQS